jgi:hypothetical protein
MTLSILKLEKLLRTNSFLIKKKFVIESNLVYVELFNINNAETFLLYIPSKFKIIVENDSNTFDIKFIDIDEENMFKNFHKKTDSIDVENEYSNSDIHLSPEKNEDLEKYLKDNYDHEVKLKNLNKDDIENLKDIYYQLTRLNLCVKNIKYKLSILYKNYLCCIRRDNTIECFIIKNYKQSQKNIYITLDLKNLFKKIENVSEDIKVVKTGINKILNNNQLKNTKLLNNILEQKNSILLTSNAIYNKKKEYENYIIKLENLLIKINDSEKKIIENIIILNEKDNNITLNNDIQKSHEIYNLEKKLDNINNVKQEIVKDIINIRNKQENITLEIDKILFNNSIMISIITKNFNSLLESLKE